MLSLSVPRAGSSRCGGCELALCLGILELSSPAPVYTLMYNIHTTQMEDFLGYLLVSNERAVVMRLAFWDRTCAPSSSWSYNFFLSKTKGTMGVSSHFQNGCLLLATATSTCINHHHPGHLSPVQDNTQGFSSPPQWGHWGKRPNRISAPYQLPRTDSRGRVCTERIARKRCLPLRPGDVCWAIQKGRMYPALVLQLNVADKDGDSDKIAECHIVSQMVCW